MEYLKDAFKRKIASRVLRSAHTFFLLDYDGTLTPIMPKPEMAKLRESTRKILEKLSKNPSFSVGIITGRRIDEIKSLVKLNNVIYAGNHGLELEGHDFSFTHVKAKASKRILSEIKTALQTFSKDFPGSFVEDKGVTLTYHYRLLDPKWVKTLRGEFVKRVSPWLNRKKIQIFEAKKALEVRPYIHWNKGSAVRWILLHEDPESLPIYIGDDKTDEDAFKAVNDRGFSISVGNQKNSYAQYYVKDIYEVERFLSSLASMKSSKFVKEV